jgi:MerR family transcriptional regulator, mercuric resistance operon regulatory protein
MNKQINGRTIGEMAGTAGVNVETVRYYQRKGLMHEPDKGYGSIRRYDEADLARLKFIKSSQKLGFSLVEVGELLKLEDGTQCNDARKLAEHKLGDVRQKLIELQRIESVLTQLINSCEASPGKVTCPIIASLKGIS